MKRTTLLLLSVLLLSAIVLETQHSRAQLVIPLPTQSSQPEDHNNTGERKQSRAELAIENELLSLIED